MAKLNHRVNQVLNYLLDIDDGKDLTLMSKDDNFQLYHKAKKVDGELTLADLQNISRHASKLKIVQLVDVSHLVFAGHVKSTDAYIKIEDDIARAFLHLIKKMKFQKPTPVTTPKGEVAV